MCVEVGGGQGVGSPGLNVMVRENLGQATSCDACDGEQGVLECGHGFSFQ